MKYRLTINALAQNVMKGKCSNLEVMAVDGNDRSLLKGYEVR